MKRRQLLQLAVTAPLAKLVPGGPAQAPLVIPGYGPGQRAMVFVFVKRHLDERMQLWKRLGVLAPNADLYLGDMYDKFQIID